jgi:putative membrane protein
MLAGTVLGIRDWAGPDARAYLGRLLAEPGAWPLVTPAEAAATGLGELLVRLSGAWDWRPAVLLSVGTLAALYLRGWWRLRRTSRTRGAAPGWRLAAYMVGLASVILALCSPLELLAELSFTAHMVQHQMLLMVGPPLLLLGAPFPLILWALPPGVRRRLGALIARPGPVRRALRTLTWMPVAGTLYTVTLWSWHHPVAYEAALRYPTLHNLEHLTFFGTAVLFWWPIVNPAPRLRRLGSGVMYGARIGYLILATGQNTLLGAVFGLSERVLYPSYAAAPRLLADWSPLDDQAFGGGVMWSGSHMFLVAVLILLHRAMDAEGRKAGARARPIV